MTGSAVIFDDLTLLKSAQRLVLQAKGDATDETSPKLIGHPEFRAPLDLEALRRVVDDVSLSHRHLERVFTAREAVYAATIERLSRSLDVLAGRVDALSKDVAEASVHTELKNVQAERAQEDTQTALLPEMENLLALGHCYMTEAIAARSSTLEEVHRIVAQLSSITRDPDHNG